MVAATRLQLAAGVCIVVLMQLALLSLFSGKLRQIWLPHGPWEEENRCLARAVPTTSPFWHGVYEDYTDPDLQLQRPSVLKLSKYRRFLVAGTLAQQDWSRYGAVPATRFETLKRAFGDFEARRGRVVVELGTSRSFTHGGIPAGCNVNDGAYWHPATMEDWDWGAGMFLRVAADCLGHVPRLSLTTVDLQRDHIARARRMNAADFPFITFVVADSVAFLEAYDVAAKGQIDLLYMDTADVHPIEPSAELHLREAQVIVARDLVAPGGTLLIDDVLNQTPVKLGDRSALGKSKYALPYLLAHGYTLEVVGYQYVLQRKQNWDAPVTAASPPYLPAAPLALLDRPLQAVHVTFHTACVRELNYVARTLRVALTHHIVTDPTLPAADGNLVYNVHHARAERLWATHRRYYMRFDLVIVSDTAALARVFLQQGVWTRKLIVWVCNRFDYRHVSTSPLALQEAAAYPHPDDEYYNLFRAAAANQRVGGHVAVVGYTAFENAYARAHRSVDLGDLVIVPTGYGATAAAAAHANTTQAPSPIPATVRRAETFFVPPYENDRALVAHCAAARVPCYRGRYAGAADLVPFLAVLHVPYAWSNFALFEAWRLGVIHVIPTLRLLLTTPPEALFWSPPLDRARLNLSEWYAPAHAPLFVFVDRWSDLAAVHARLLGDKKYRASVRRRVVAAAEARRERSVGQWAALLQKL